MKVQQTKEITLILRTKCAHWNVYASMLASFSETHSLLWRLDIYLFCLLSHSQKRVYCLKRNFSPVHLLGTLACTLVEGGAAVEKGEKAQIGKSFAAEQGCQLVQLNAWHRFVTRVNTPCKKNVVKGQNL